MSARVDSPDQRFLFPKAAQEKHVVEQVMGLLEKRRIFHARTDSSYYFVDGEWRAPKINVAGWPDITAVLPDGRFLGIECKRKGEKARKSQVWCAKTVRFNRAVYIVVDEVESMEEELDRLVAESLENVRILEAHREGKQVA